MTEGTKGSNTLADKGFVPWQRHAVNENGQEQAPNLPFQVRYKRRYLLAKIALVLGFVWMAISIIDDDMSAMFFAVAPFVFAPFILSARFFAKLPAVVMISMFVIIALALVYFMPPGAADLLGKITVISTFFVFLPTMGLIWGFTLFDGRPQLLIGPEGICCRQYGEGVIPWDDIGSIYVTTYERLWILKVKTLVIGLRNVSCYPKPSSVWTPHYLFYGISKLFKQPYDLASVNISGLLLDPTLPFVMKAIKHYRPVRKPKGGRRQGSTPSEMTRS